LVAPTDSRRRPDQRALEVGDLKLAAKFKSALEIKQRATCRKLEGANKKHKTNYFDLVDCNEYEFPQAVSSKGKN